MPLYSEIWLFLKAVYVVDFQRIATLASTNINELTMCGFKSLEICVVKYAFIIIQETTVKSHIHVRLYCMEEFKRLL